MLTPQDIQNFKRIQKDISTWLNSKMKAYSRQTFSIAKFAQDSLLYTPDGHPAWPKDVTVKKLGHFHEGQNFIS